VTDAVQIALITGVTAALPTLVIGVLSYLNNRKRDKTVGEIHTLVNSQMGEQLWIGMIAAQSLALAKPTKENRKLAESAEKKYNQHQARQSKVDAGP
jgi:hypothetical protein